jgi:hypothetical protein
MKNKYLHFNILDTLVNFLFIYLFQHQLNLVQESVLVSSGSNLLPIGIVQNRTVVFTIKFWVNLHRTN